jgi:hypothetical protein
MEECQSRKYSKVSAALKCYFLRNLYFHRLSIKEVSFNIIVGLSTLQDQLLHSQDFTQGPQCQGAGLRKDPYKGKG